MTNRPLHEVQRLRLLHEVSRHGSLAGATTMVGTGSSAVSRQIFNLERETGVPLLDRAPRGVALTGAGEALVERARDAPQLLGEPLTFLDQRSGELAGRVRIDAIASDASSVMLPGAERLGAPTRTPSSR